VHLTVLDQSPVPEGSRPSEALANSVDLAQLADRSGYHRYWVAEHHNSTGLAGSAPEILIGHLAQATERIRVGSAGVMLSHYSPYKVAEVFRVLEVLHPGRIDLGFGRAPGTDSHTAYALARGGTPGSIEYFPNLVEELLQYLHDAVPDDSPLASVHARPAPEDDHHPEVWVLASSHSSAGLAAHFGLPLGWAYFIGGDGAEITDAYRRQYQPSRLHPEPKVSVAVAAVCADTEAEAEHVASSLRAWRSGGLRGPIPRPTAGAAPDAPLAVSYGPAKPLIVGTAEQVRAGIDGVAAAHGADEVAVVTITHDHAARRRSYELLATAYGLAD
jgi:luciferase family oxidoreductase group 1